MLRKKIANKDDRLLSSWESVEIYQHVLISVTENKTTKAFLVLPCLSMGERSHREGGGSLYSSLAGQARRSQKCFSDFPYLYLQKINEQ